MSAARQQVNVDAQRILEDLSRRQFLRPHATVREALSASAGLLGFCSQVADRAMQWLEVDPDQRFGRLRRTELVQLARSLHRFWQRANAETRPLTKS